MLRASLLCLSCFGMLIPTSVLHAANTGPTTIDVGLHEGGVLIGQLVNVDGTPEANAKISLRRPTDELATTTATNKSGFFSFKSLGGGAYEIASDQTQDTLRLWVPNTAPPSAQRGVLLVKGRGVTRGQNGPIAYWLSNPWVIGGIVALAVAIPVAVHNSSTSRTQRPASP